MRLNFLDVYYGRITAQEIRAMYETLEGVQAINTALDIWNADYKRLEKVWREDNGTLYSDDWYDRHIAPTAYAIAKVNEALECEDE